MVQRADDAAGQEDGRREHDRLAGRSQAHELQPGEQERDDDRREDLEEALHPEVHHPPAPVLGEGEVRVAAVHERGAVEAGDGAADEMKKRTASVPLLVVAPKRRAGSRGPQEQPQEQPDQQRDLAGAPEVDVFVAAVPEVEPERVAQEVA